MTKPALSLVLPAYNEDGNIGRAVRDAAAAAAPLVADYEVVVVDDGSRDGTASVLDEPEGAGPRLVVVRHPPNRGYGAALRAGSRPRAGASSTPTPTTGST